MYDLHTGLLKWSTAEVVYRRVRGRAITTIDNVDGYIVLTLTFNGKRKTYYAHRVIWKYMTGETPDTVDHKNRKRTDNRWVNLRNTTPKGNAQNNTPANLFCKKWHRYQLAKLELGLLK